MPKNLEHSGTAWQGQHLPHHSPFIDDLDPRTKVACGFLLALIIAFSETFTSLIFALGLALGFAFLAKLPLKRTVKRLIAMEAFMTFLILLLPFTTPGTPFLTIGSFSASTEGLLHALQILIKANAVVLVLLSLVGTMSASTFGHTLAYFKVSDKLIHILLFMVRYIEVIGKEYRRMQQAMRARAYILRFNFHTWRSTGYLVGMLLIHSLDRSERINQAMKCRGFTGRLYLLDNFSIKRTDVFFAVTVIILGLIMIGLNG